MISFTPHQQRLFLLIFLPLIKLSGLFIAGYLLITWLLKLQMFQENTIDYIGPLVGAWICSFIWIRPRLQLLKLKDVNSSLFYALLVMALPLIALRQFVKKNRGEIRTLYSIYQIDEDNPSNSYYKFQHYFFDKQHASFVDSQETRDKGRKRVFYRHYVIPIVGYQADTASRTCSAWLGLSYNEEMSNSNDERIIQAALMDFIAKTKTEFSMPNNMQFLYLERLGNTDAHDRYKEAIDHNTVYKNENALGYNMESYRVLIPIKEPFENRARMAGVYVVASLLCPLVFWLWLQRKQIDESVLERWMETDA